VLQGERPMASDNRTLGRFQLVGLPGAPRGVPQIDVTFDIDANGIVNVTATDQATGKAQALTITASSGLSKEAVDRLVKDAEAHARDDAARRDAVTKRNDADALVYSVEKTVRDQGGSLEAEQLATVETAVGDVKSALAKDDCTALGPAVERLQRVSQGLAEQLYRKAQGSSGQPSNGATEGDVVEGEVVK